MKLLVVKILIIVCCSIALLGGLCSSAQDRVDQAIIRFSQEFNVDRLALNADLREFVRRPHPFGSKAQASLGKYISMRAETLGFKVIEREFTAFVPNGLLLESPDAPAPLTLQRTGRNIFAFAGVKKKPRCFVAMASHYDTKEIAGVEYVGANDSASSSIALFQLLQAVRKFAEQTPLGCEVVAIWFDGEESQLPDWHDGQRRHPAAIADHTYGSRFEAAQLVTCLEKKNAKCLGFTKPVGELQALILLDMIGSPNVILSKDSNASPRLWRLLTKIDKKLNKNSILSKQAKPIEDDHIPFLSVGVAALNLIDFEHTAYWHQPDDLPENISLESIEKVSRMALAVVLSLGANPDWGKESN